MNNIDNDFDLDVYQDFGHPIDLVEQIASGCDWPVRRLSDSQVLVLVDFSGTQYQVFLNFDDSEDVLRLTCAFHFAIDASHNYQFLELLNHVNSKTWFGNFTYDFEQKAIVFWYALVLPDDGNVKPDQTYALLNGAPEVCKQFMPCFQAAQQNDYEKAKLLSNAWRRTGGNA